MSSDPTPPISEPVVIELALATFQGDDNVSLNPFNPKPLTQELVSKPLAAYQGNTFSNPNEKGKILPFFEEIVYEDSVPPSPPHVPWDTRLSSEYTAKMALREITSVDIHRFRERFSRAAKPESALLKPPPRALYILVENNQTAAILQPAHCEIVGTDRADLKTIHLTPISCDLLHPGPLNARNYLIGDLFCVFSLIECPMFWRVGDFQVLPREIIRNRLVVIQGPSLENESSETICLATGLNQPVIAADDLLLNKINLRGSFYEAEIFIPPVQPGQFLKGSNMSSFAEIVRLQPRIVRFHDVSPDTRRELEMSPKVFAHEQDDLVAYQALVNTTKFGWSAVLAMENWSLDPRKYSTVVEWVSNCSRIKRFSFSISTKDRSLTWAPGDKIDVQLTNDTVFQAEIESVQKMVDETRVSVVTSKKRVRITEGMEIRVCQSIIDNLWQLSLFPSLEVFTDAPKSCNGRRTIRALCGGEAIPALRNVSDSPIVLSTGFILTAEQSRYAQILAHYDTPAIVANAPFGVGKTTMLAAAAITAAATDPTSCHVATCMTNFGTAAIANAFIRLDPRHVAPAVRLITEAGRNRLPAALRTEIDYPVLRIRVMVDYVLRKDSQDEELLSATLWYLQVSGDLPFISYSLLASIPDEKPTMSSYQVFLAIFKPRILIGTFTSLLGRFTWDTCSVRSVQIDEASQMPLYAVLALIGHFPMAKFAFIGDHLQLPAYHHMKLPEVMAELAVGDILGEVSEDHNIPQVSIMTVFRCPYQITEICSRLFYDEALVPGVPQIPMPYLSLFGFTEHHPLQVIDLSCSSQFQCGSSLSNREEALVAVEIVRRLARKTDIGILCFYQAQAVLVSKMLSEEEVFVDTIEASRGRSWSVTVILTTRTSNFSDAYFLHENRRLNVALSRANQLAILIVDVPASRGVPLWRILIDALPPGAVTSSGTFSREWH